MKQCGTTLSRAFILSFAVHAAVFGSALAFAHFSGPWQEYPFRSITVSLVEDGKTAGTRKKVVEPAPARPVVQPSSAIISEQPAAVSAQPDGPLQESVMPEPAALPETPGGGGREGEEGAAILAGKDAGGPGNGVPFDQLQHLRLAIESAKTYPRLARERGIEGTVLVKFKMLPSGDVETVSVVKSSGVQILDDASVRTVYRAAPMPFVNGWVEVPMVYELK